MDHGVLKFVGYVGGTIRREIYSANYRKLQNGYDCHSYFWLYYLYSIIIVKVISH